MANVDYIDNGNDDGANLGRSDGKIGFYGLAAPIVVQTITVKASLSVGTANVNTFIKADVTAILTALSNLGLITIA